MKKKMQAPERNLSKYLPIAVTLALAALVFYALLQLRASAPGAGLQEGQRAPDFTLEYFDGGQVKLSELRGQVVMLNFWSAACPPCRAEMPAMQTVYADLSGRGFTILAVNVNDELAVAKRFLTENNYTFPAAKDDGQVSRLYEVRYIPKTVILDREGKIRVVRVGELHEAQLRRLVEPLL